MAINRRRILSRHKIAILNKPRPRVCMLVAALGLVAGASECKAACPPDAACSSLVVTRSQCNLTASVSPWLDKERKKFLNDHKIGANFWPGCIGGKKIDILCGDEVALKVETNEPC